ncbi:nose resistant to fluoxetine protein 6 [Rhagoletis pomonella]|uniref:nose resistant to fluoxetine protein 6 n=1 Tax=Rhagoletis pomonella TaxID=28610 RepID=UPI00178601DB|nr:nose resistant to fluoxetine protein 6 [Rhagoletis pomonella]
MEYIFTVTLYKEMPPLYQFDDYDQCLRFNGDSSFTKATYCVVYAEIVANKSSTLWNEISRISLDNLHHFRHDHLFFGVCLQRCKKLLKPFAKIRINELSQNGDIQDIELLNYYINVHKRETDKRVQHGKVFSSCLNYEFQKRYGLKLRTSVEYCEEAQTPLKHDALDIVIYTIFGIISLFTIFSTMYDYRLKTKQPLSNQNNEFYKNQFASPAQQVLLSFSICRNFYRITDSTKTRSQTVEDLKFFDGLRVIGVFLVLFAHSLILYMALQIENPEFFEKFFYRPETDIIENGAAIIQIFFVMSGFLLYVNFNERKLINTNTTIRDCIIVYFKIFFHRYLRLLPSLIMLILFNSTILARLQNGPYWRHYVEAERVFCREYWWQNVFFVNNYLLRESCSHHTWYLAADMQLFELFLIVLIVITKFPRLRIVAYAILFVLTFSVTGLITYFLKLKPIYHTTPENYRYMFFRNAETFYQAYTPFYTNIGGYFFSFITAELYLKLRHKSERYRGLLSYEIGWWLIFPISFGLLFGAGFLMSLEFEQPSVWVALFASLYRNIWVLICCGAVLGMCLKLGWIAYEFCCLPILRIFSKISYQAYLWHLVVLRLTGGFYRQPIYINRFYLISQIIVAFFLTQLIAFAFALFVEYPIAEIIKCILPYYKSERKQRKRDIYTLN